LRRIITKPTSQHQTRGLSARPLIVALDQVNMPFGWAMFKDLRIGHGFDAHRFRRGRRLVLGGIEVPHDRGLLGHSDADAVLHALINALFGAMAEGDIGTHFPDHDPRYKGIASSELLVQALRTMRRKRYKLINADITLVAQEPKLAPHYLRMRENVAKLCQVAVDKISIKAATTERLGWIGKAKGMAATAVVLLAR